jgi:putative transposase
MSRKGDCWDNAVAESFFGSMKRECVNKHRFRTRADAVRVIGDYIDGFYNVRRRHSTLNYVSPIEFELQFKKTELERQAA